MMPSFSKIRVALQTVLPFFASLAYSCPVCHTRVGEQIRAGIFNDAFGWNLLTIVLPFPVFAGVVAAIYFTKPSRQIKISADPPNKTTKDLLQDDENE
jgi:hypothetical protein